MQITTRLTATTTRLLNDTPPPVYRGALALLVALLVTLAIGWQPAPIHQSLAPILSRDTAHAGHTTRPADRPAPPAAIPPLPTSMLPTDVPTEQIIVVMRELPSDDLSVATVAAPTPAPTDVPQLDQDDPRCTGATGEIDPSCGLTAAQLREAMDR
jgi:hypothetical protein